MDAGMEGMEGIPEDREGSRRDEDRAGATTGLIPFFFISLRSPLRLARALSSAVLPAALSAASLPRRFASSASICALPSAMAKARRCFRTLIGRGGRRERRAGLVWTRFGHGNHARSPPAQRAYGGGPQTEPQVRPGFRTSGQTVRLQIYQDLELLC